MTPLRVSQGISARIASQPQAVTGTDNTMLMTPLRVQQQIAATGIVAGAQIAFSAHKNGVNQTGVANGVATKITFGTELYDLGNLYDTSNSRWTPPSGQVHITGSAFASAGVTAAQGLILSVYKNGVLFKSETTIAGSTSEGIAIDIDDVASGTDFYELFIQLSSSTTGTISGVAANTYFMGHFLGEVGSVTLGLAQVGFRAHKNGVSQNIPSSVYTKATFGFEDYDQGSHFDIINSRWTPPVGLMHLDAGVWFNSGASGPYAIAAIYKNGVSYKQGVVAVANATPGSQISIDDLANGTDYYELFVNVASGGVAVLDGSLNNTWFGGHALVGIQGATGPQGPQGADGAITAPVSNSGRLRWVSPILLSFTPYNGDRIKISGVFQQIPAAGIAGLANTNVYVNGVTGQFLAANTTYYVYAFMNAGVLTADFSVTGHTSSATAGNVGVEIKIGDDTRTLIGMIRTGGTGGVQFMDTAAMRFVLSWFNRRGKSLGGSQTGTYIFSGSWQEISSAARVNFLTWSDECVAYTHTGYMQAYDTDLGMYAGLGLDNTTSPFASTYTVQRATWSSDVSFAGMTEMSEGFHFMTPLGYGYGYYILYTIIAGGMIQG
jgi:hypothetical protein